MKQKKEPLLDTPIQKYIKSIEKGSFPSWSHILAPHDIAHYWFVMALKRREDYAKLRDKDALLPCLIKGERWTVKQHEDRFGSITKRVSQYAILTSSQEPTKDSLSDAEWKDLNEAIKANDKNKKNRYAAKQLLGNNSLVKTYERVENRLIKSYYDPSLPAHISYHPALPKEILRDEIERIVEIEKKRFFIKNPTLKGEMFLDKRTSADTLIPDKEMFEIIELDFKLYDRYKEIEREGFKGKRKIIIMILDEIFKQFEKAPPRKDGKSWHDYWEEKECLITNQINKAFDLIKKTRTIRNLSEFLPARKSSQKTQK